MGITTKRKRRAVERDQADPEQADPEQHWPGLEVIEHSTRLVLLEKETFALDQVVTKQAGEGNGMHSVGLGPDARAGDQAAGDDAAAPGLAGNQEQLARNQQAGAKQTGQTANAVTQATDQIIRAEQYIRSVDPILQMLAQRQRTMQLWGR